MKFINKKIILVAIILMAGIILLGISKPKDYIKLESVNLRSDKENNMFAIMLEQDDGTYKEDNSNNWPTSGYTYNIDKSGCIDVNGNEIENSLSYNTDTKNVSIRTKEASYCYLYFSIPKWCNKGETASECLLRKPTTGLNNTNIEAGMYRYQGNGNNNDIVNNYVCFGTDNKLDCANNTDAYMYRIIGIRSNGQIKLIKKEALNSTIKWWNNYKDNIEWPSSNIYTALNGNSYLLNDIYVPTGWESKIATITWKYGDTANGANYDGPAMYDTENPFGESTASNRFAKEVSAKIGLMYIHDYYYAYASGGAPGSASNAKTAWIHLSKNDTSVPNNTERVMSRYGYFYMLSRYSSWGVFLAGDVGYTINLSDGTSVRPVFYLKHDIEIFSGIGTVDDPFIIG